MSNQVRYGATSGAAMDRFFGQNGFLGVDFTSAPELVDPARFSDGANIWRDYDSGGGAMVETFPGCRRICRLPGAVFGIHHFFTPSEPSHTEYAVIHAGDALYMLSSGEDVPRLLFSGMAAHESVGFVTADALWLLDGQHYVKVFYDREAAAFKAQDVKDMYVPMTFRNGAPYEQRNALSDYFKEGWDILDPSLYSLETEGLLYEVTDPDALVCEVVKITEKKEEITIPATVRMGGQTYTVTAVGARAFQNDNTVRRVTVEKGVQRIGDFAFNTCLSLPEVFLPSPVKEIAQGAFAYSPFTRIYLGRGLKSVGRHAFRYCEHIGEVVYEGTQEEFGEISFDINNEALTGAARVYEAHDAYSLGTYGFALNEPCETLSEVLLDGKPLPWAPYTLTGDTVFSPDKTYFEKRGDVYTEAPVTAGAAVTEDTYYEFHPVYTTGLVDTADGKSMRVVAADYRMLLGTTLQVKGRYRENAYAKQTPTTFRSSNPTYSGTDSEAITHTTKAALFDGRVFLTGNPALPNTVFYSQRDLTGHSRADYFGICNFFDDGTSNTPNAAMTALSDALLVYKKDTLSESVVYCHKGQDTGNDYIPRVYPCQSGIAGMGSVGQALNFADDAVFVSQKGLEAVGTLTVNLERSVVHRSTLVDGRLLTEELADSRLCEWKGYLLLLCPGGHLYMADSRRRSTAPSGRVEYEWYYLEGVGSYENDIPVYRYAENYPHGILSMSAAGQPLSLREGRGIPFGSYEAYERMYDKAVYAAEVTAITLKGEEVSLSAVWARETDESGREVLYLLTPTTERTAGDFAPARTMGVVGQRLLLGTKDGVLLCANTDKRGEIYHLNEAEDENTPLSKGEIDRHYYSYDNHRFLSYVMTRSDHGGVPHMTKNTTKGTTVLALKHMQGSAVKLSVHTDRQGWTQVGAYSEGTLRFVDFDMGQTVFETESAITASFKEKTKRWTYKKYALYSDEYQRPFGIRHLAYRCTVAGRIKNK